MRASGILLKAAHLFSVSFRMGLAQRGLRPLLLASGRYSMSYLIGLSLFSIRLDTPDNRSQGEGWPLQKDNHVIFFGGGVAGRHVISVNLEIRLTKWTTHQSVMPT